MCIRSISLTPEITQIKTLTQTEQSRADKILATYLAVAHDPLESIS